MTAPGPVGPAVPAAPTDPRELALHLEICRMQAELEGLEEHIRQVEAARSEGRHGYDPFVERAEELMERMVASLYVSGRSEIAAARAATDERAEALLEDARQRAQAILAEARAELATALLERAEAIEDPTAEHVVDLTDGAGAVEDVVDQRSVDADIVVAEDPDAVVDARDVLPVDAESVDTELVDAETVDVLPVDTEPVDDEADAEVASPDPSLLLPPPPPAPSAAGQVDLWLTPPAEPVSLPLLPPPGAASELPGETRSEVDEPTPSAVEIETARTDAAFDAWLAVGPPVSEADRAETGEAIPGLADLGDEDGPRRPAWVRPVEAAIALGTVALAVVLLLLLVG